ncbi:hypothetical protein HYY71_07070 [Candidatus Woesearchaeota archaeon]|nr:hypothetical protein [Candidatus Woesearchaeota archaeon]
MNEKKEKKKWGMIVFIIFIMIGTSFSFVFFGFSGARETVKYKELKFVRLQDRWEAKINGINAAFSFLPDEVESVLAFEDFSKELQGKFEIDVTYDFNSTYKESIALAHHQMGLTLAAYNIFVRKGFTANNSFNLPIITCDNATINVPVVYFKHGNATRIHTENYCIIAEAPTNADFIRVKDRLLYGMLGVMG